MGAVEDRALSAFVRRLRLHSDLNEEEQKAVLALPGLARGVARNREIVRPGNVTTKSYLVADGLLVRFDRLQDGRKANTALHIAGDVCDLHSVVSPMAGSGVAAITDAVVVDLPHNALKEIAVTFPAIALAFWRDTAADAAALKAWAVRLGRMNATARIAHLFCEMGYRMEEAQLGSRHSYDLPVNQEQLADTVGLTPVHTNRVLKALRKAGIADLRARHVHVLDLDLLMSVGEFEPPVTLATLREARSR
ncbi:Crp/Fnr family transcriptional regulator [Sphingomonas aerophila]|jgi:CRP-like cAMP-binding protein|uniref:CRP-like cAMP-binding protein n=1 Tax=Sphingomonas aerophila TaxID=1344948 RepID=A0A7W9EXW7_9SPHN|nr:Crp/Fnr family transcriptional regulator [Sphingomonas aerophila]MBB5716993.1 CRP-like cAMP-binding protein [Sphingomonas aerophila]